MVKVKGDIDIDISIGIVIDTDKQFLNNIEIILNLKTSLTADWLIHLLSQRFRPDKE